MEEIAFGIFDHLERRDEPLEQIYKGRFELIADADAAGFFCYHIAEHHATPLGMAPRPASSSPRSRSEPAGFILARWSIFCLCYSAAADPGNLHDRSDEWRPLRNRCRGGVSPFELAYYRVPFMESREMFEEALAVLVAGLRNPRLTHRGHYYRYDGVPIELEAQQKPNPPFWYGAATPDSINFAARHGMNVVGNGTNAMLRRSTAQYLDELAKHKGGPDDLNPHIAAPRRGAIRHIYVAADEREVGEIARPGYRAYYDNITELWRDFYTTPTHGFTPDLDLARRSEVAIAGTANEVIDAVGSSSSKAAVTMRSCHSRGAACRKRRRAIRSNASSPG